MNKNLVSYYDKLADEVVLTVILNGATNISKTYIVQTLLEAHNAGFSIGADAREQEQEATAAKAALSIRVEAKRVADAEPPRPIYDIGDASCG